MLTRSQNGNGLPLRTYSWKPADTKIAILRRAQAVVEVNNYKGEVLHASTTYGPVPRGVLSVDAQSIVLASGPVAVAGSFAPTVDDAGFTHKPLYDETTLYYDGTNGSRIIRKRRTDGYIEPLPPGHLRVTGLTPGTAGGTAPTYYMYPFNVPGACNIGWVAGDVGSPRFMHRTPNSEALHQQRIRGREALTDIPLAITLQAVPAPPPPPEAPPDTPSGNVAGTLSLTVTTPGQNATVMSGNGGGFKIHMDASDTANPLSMFYVLEGATVLWSVAASGLSASVDAQIALYVLGSHTLTCRVVNSIAQVTNINLTVNVQDPPPPPPPPDPDPILLPCVMLGTEIVPIGEAEWWSERLTQNEWARLVTDSGRELIAVPAHRVYTSRAGLTEMRDIRKGDKAVTVLGEETVTDIRLFTRPGIKVCVHMKAGHLYWANGILSHNMKIQNLGA